MAEYAPGMRVVIRDEEWIVKKVETNTLNNRALHCVGITPLVKDVETIFLDDLEKIVVVDPRETKLVIDDSSHYRRSQLYIESQWRQQIPTDSGLHIGHQALMDTMDFQLQPAQKALKCNRQRILIADAVGLGKTLEAGILMSELIARGKGKRILVVTVKSMMGQFQKEMWNRFTIPLVRLDSAKIQRIKSSMPANHNPFYRYDKTIVSIDTLKKSLEYRTHLENAYWDIIVIDEAHNVAERGDGRAQRATLAKLLAERSDTMIMLSATPHDGSKESFASLMRMLDPTAIADKRDYGPEDIGDLCIRRSKKDVASEISGDFPERKTKIETCKASAIEEYAWNIFAELKLQMDMTKRQGSGELFKTLLEKAFCSSPAACMKTIETRLKSLLKKEGVTEDFDDVVSLKELYSALEQIKTNDFSRYQKLLSVLKSEEYAWKPNATDDRLVIFTERIETMKFIANHLREDLQLNDDAVQEISGALSDKEQMDIIKDFGDKTKPIRVLVASDVASEGLNLHYLSHRMIHFDIPWSLMCFQQRNGRVDRYGQTKTPDIRYLLMESDCKKAKDDMRTFQILINKEKNAHDNIGDELSLGGCFDQEGQELKVKQVIESGNPDALLDNNDGELDWDALCSNDDELQEVNIVDKETTLFDDKEYINFAVKYLNRNDHIVINDLGDKDGLELQMTQGMEQRLRALIPEEEMPEVGGYLCLSRNKEFCNKEMFRSMQCGNDVSLWPKVQYLWPLHPIFSWLNDKIGLLYDRNEAPLIGLNGPVEPGEMYFIMSGTIPNRKSQPMVDEWFAVHFKDEHCVGISKLSQMLETTGFMSHDLPNMGELNESDSAKAKRFIDNAVQEAYAYMNKAYEEYKEMRDPLINEEIAKLGALQTKHKAVQLSLFENNKRKLEAGERQVDELFGRYVNWVHDTLELQNNPYIRIIAVLMGEQK